MGGKRKFSNAANAKSKASQFQKKKNKKNKKKKGSAESDWYTSDSVVGLFGNGKRQKREENKSFTEPPPTDDVEDDVASSSSDEDDQDLEPVNDHYNDLVNTLIDSAELAKEHRAILRRIRREQQGVEDVSDQDSDDEQLEEEEEEEEEEEVEVESDEEMEPNSSKRRVKEEEDSDKADEGSRFLNRFVSYHGLSEASMEKDALKTTAVEKQKSKVSIAGKNYLMTSMGNTPVFKPQKFLSEAVQETQIDEFGNTFEIKHRLAKRWLEYATRRHKICKRRLGEDSIPKRNRFGLSELQTNLADRIFGYTDIMFADRSLENASELRELYVLHALNHVFKAQDLVAKHDARIRAKRLLERKLRDKKRLQAATGAQEDLTAEEEALKKLVGDESEDDNTFRDQGFTRPKALIMVPTRHAGLRIVRLMLELLPTNVAVANKSRVWEEFLEDDDDGLHKEITTRAKREKVDASASYDELYLHANEHPVQQDEKTKRRPMPSDFHDVFTGNRDECFRMGVACNNRKSVRLFTDFYRSDIIIATPVGLRMATGQEIGDALEDPYSKDDIVGDDSRERHKQEEEQEARLVEQETEGLEELGLNAKEEEARDSRRKRKEETDFLSSIELCIVDQVDVLEMQNWQHVVDIMSAVNRKPIQLREDMDFTRVKSYFLHDGLCRRFRQTLVYSQFPSPLYNALFVPKTNARMNLAGMVTIRPLKYDGVLSDVQVKHVGHKFVRLPSSPSSNDENSEDEYNSKDPRLEYFEENLLEPLSRKEAEHTLVVVPSFLDYVGVRNLFRKAAAKLGETGNRAKGKPSKAPKRKVVVRNGKRIKKNTDTEQVLFVCVSEYSEPSDVARARADFFQGRARIMVTTERFHFYHRFRLRGIQRLVFYTPPVHAHFYTELSDLIESSESLSSSSHGKTEKETSKVIQRNTPTVSNLTLFDNTDIPALERIVGTQNLKTMLASTEKAVFDFFYH